MERHSAGDIVSSYCTKCNVAQNHIITAMEKDVIAKVKCTTCGAVHKFRDPAAVKKTRSGKKQEDALKAAEVLWESCLATAKGKERTYDMGGRYRVGEVVLHDTFGKGVVRKLYSNKCGVLFKDKERLMASGN